jgi:hypothetical protein
MRTIQKFTADGQLLTFDEIDMPKLENVRLYGKNESGRFIYHDIEKGKFNTVLSLIHGSSNQRGYVFKDGNCNNMTRANCQPVNKSAAYRERAPYNGKKTKGVIYHKKKYLEVTVYLYQSDAIKLYPKTTFQKACVLFNRICDYINAHGFRNPFEDASVQLTDDQKAYIDSKLAKYERPYIWEVAK